MLIVEPSATLEWITPNAAQHIERAGRVCYKSESRITPTSSATFIANLCKRGHLSVLEHAVASIRFICDRGVSHEAVRHRVASFSQESTRYCSYAKEAFGAQLTFIEPPFRHEDSKAEWVELCKNIEQTYMSMLARAEMPEIARAVLPCCLKTEFVMTCNFREWLHVFDLRTSPRAHPQIVEVMLAAQKLLASECPEVFALETP